MAAREDRVHTNQVRARIQTSQLITRLENNALDELDIPMTKEQIASARIVLAKAMPDLKATDVQPDADGELKPFSWDK
jgi:hypothetical protein